MIRILALGAGVVVAGGAAFFAMLALLDGPGRQGGMPLEATRCEIELGPERCPGQPGFEPAKKARIFVDNVDKASSDIERCMQRAADLHAYCKSTGQVTARYYRGRQLVKVATRR